MDSDLSLAYGWAYMNQQSGLDDMGGVDPEPQVEASSPSNKDVSLQGTSRSSDSNSNVSNNADLDIDSHREELSRYLESREKFSSDDQSDHDDFEAVELEEAAILNTFPSENNDVNHISAEIDNYINDVAGIENEDHSNQPVDDQAHSSTTSADERDDHHRHHHGRSDADDLDDLDPDLSGGYAIARRHVTGRTKGLTRPCRPKTRNSSTSLNARYCSGRAREPFSSLDDEMRDSSNDVMPYLDHDLRDIAEGDHTHFRRQTLPRSSFPDHEVQHSSSASSRGNRNQRRPKTMTVDGLTSKILEDIRFLYADDVFDIDEQAKARMEIRTRLRMHKNELPTSHFVNWVATKWRENYDKCMHLQKCIDQFDLDLEATIDTTLRRLLLNRIIIDKAWQENLQENMDFDILVADYRLCFASVDRDRNISLRGQAAQALQRELLLSCEVNPPPLPETSPPASPLRAVATPQKPAQEQITEHAEIVTKGERKCIEIHHINPEMHVVDLKSTWKVPPVSLAANREKRQYKDWSWRPRERTGGDRRTKWERTRDTVLVKLLRCFLK